jgi:hypothetical protein
MNNRFRHNSRKNRYGDIRNQISNEAVQIAKELGNIAFVGAAAVYFHTKSDRSRTTHDLDLAMATPISNEYLEEKGYRIFEERKKEKSIWTPRNSHVDIFTEDVGNISVKYIINTAKSIPVGKRGEIVRVANIEVLIITKYRANRQQDAADLFAIAKTKFSEIDWSSLKSLTKSDYEFQDIKTTMNQYYKSDYGTY